MPPLNWTTSKEGAYQNISIDFRDGVKFFL